MQHLPKLLLALALALCFAMPLIMGGCDNNDVLPDQGVDAAVPDLSKPDLAKPINDDLGNVD